MGVCRRQYYVGTRDQRVYSKWYCALDMRFVSDRIRSDGFVILKYAFVGFINWDTLSHGIKTPVRVNPRETRVWLEKNRIGYCKIHQRRLLLVRSQ